MIASAQELLGIERLLTEYPDPRLQALLPPVCHVTHVPFSSGNVAFNEPEYVQEHVDAVKELIVPRRSLTACRRRRIHADKQAFPFPVGPPQGLSAPQHPPRADAVSPSSCARGGSELARPLAATPGTPCDAVLARYRFIRSK